jgi:hypothetical protein
MQRESASHLSYQRTLIEQAYSLPFELTDFHEKIRTFIVRF